MPFPIDVNQLIQGNTRELAKAITLVESTHPEDQAAAHDLLKALPTLVRQPLKIGISGPPGVGKSTLLESLGLKLIDQGKKVAILAIDPSSSLSAGSILGDKTRMVHLAKHPHAFIRPQPSKGHLGGVSIGTQAALSVLGVAGFDVLFVETVGTGQSEAEVRSLVDVFVLLVQPASGDDLQWMKRGSLELADILVVTKNDGALAAYAKQTQRALKASIALQSQCHAQVLTLSAVTQDGLDALLNAITNC